MKFFKFFLFFLLFSKIQSLVAQEESYIPEPISCFHGEGDAFTEIIVDFDTKNLRSTQSSVLTPTYIDVPANAKIAIEKALSIWASYLVTAMPIRIKITWESLATSTLAQTGATRVFRDFTAAPYKNVWYPVALAEAITSKELNSGDYDINVSLNKNINWSYDVSGKAVSQKFDMVTVVLHEIAHGLGFNSTLSLTENNAQGKWGQSSYPYIYDIFVRNGSQQTLYDTKIFGNPSTELYRELTGNNLFFRLTNNTSLGSPKIHAPNSFRIGGSISHLDENSYPIGTENSMMSPNVRSAEINHKPGNLILLMLNQLGWGIRNLPTDKTKILSEETESESEIIVFPNPATETIFVAFPLASPRYLGISFYDLQGRLLLEKNTMNATSESYRIDVTTFPSGNYILKTQNKATIKSHRIIVSH